MTMDQVLVLTPVQLQEALSVVLLACLLLDSFSFSTVAGGGILYQLFQRSRQHLIPLHPTTTRLLTWVPIRALILYQPRLNHRDFMSVSTQLFCWYTSLFFQDPSDPSTFPTTPAPLPSSRYNDTHTPSLVSDPFQESALQLAHIPPAQTGLYTGAPEL